VPPPALGTGRASPRNSLTFTGPFFSTNSSRVWPGEVVHDEERPPPGHVREAAVPQTNDRRMLQLVQRLGFREDRVTSRSRPSVVSALRATWPCVKLFAAQKRDAEPAGTQDFQRLVIL